MAKKKANGHSPPENNGHSLTTVEPEEKRELTVRERIFCRWIIKGWSSKQAYLKISPEVTEDTAYTEGPAYLGKPWIQRHIKELVEQSDREAIFERGEIIRRHLDNLNTPIGQIDEGSVLAQEVEYTIVQPADEEGRPEIIKKKVKSMSKMDSLKEVARLKRFTDSSLTVDINARVAVVTVDQTKENLVRQCAESPVFADAMCQTLAFAVQHATSPPELSYVTKDGRRMVAEWREA